ncbi:MAG: CRTAC1 family protein [Rhodospirillales bacterium]
MNNLAIKAATLLLSLAAWVDVAHARVVFQEVTGTAEVMAGDAGRLASGSAWRDYDFDGYPDLFVGNHFDRPTLNHNLRDGTFADVTDQVLMRPPTAVGIWGDKHGSSWADFDNDGDRDLLVLVGAKEGTGSGATQLYAYDKKTREFVDQAAVRGIDYPLSRGRVATWLDYDNDGRLDVFSGAEARPDGLAPPTLFHQLPGGTFVDVRKATGFTPVDAVATWISDLNRDGRMDILFRGTKTGPTSPRPSGINVIDTTTIPFRDVTPTKLRANDPDLAIADYDGDLRPDVFIANQWFPPTTPFGHDLYFNTKAGWVNGTVRSGINQVTRSARPGAIAADFDNDMDVDIFLDCSAGYPTVGQGGDLPNIILWNRGDGTFTVDRMAGGAAGRSTGWADTATAADYDVDGFVDLFLTYDKERAQLYHNGGNGNHWLEIDLTGIRSNRDGIGAQVYVTAGGKTQLREQNGGVHRFWGQNDQRLHFGLGSNDQASAIVVDWPSGVRQHLAGVTADRVVTITEPQ